MALRIERIPTLNDNYTYLVICESSGDAAVIDALAEDDCLVGSEAAKRLGLSPDDTVTVEGASLRVAGILDSTGTVNDDRVFMHLHQMQTLLDFMIKGFAALATDTADHKLL